MEPSGDCSQHRGHGWKHIQCTTWLCRLLFSPKKDTILRMHSLLTAVTTLVHIMHSSCIYLSCLESAALQAFGREFSLAPLIGVNIGSKWGVSYRHTFMH